MLEHPEREAQTIHEHSRLHNFSTVWSPVHTARSVKKWLSDNSINLLDWPSSSPDLNVIENCWHILKQKVAATRSTSYDELVATIKRVCVEEITP